MERAVAGPLDFRALLFSKKSQRGGPGHRSAYLEVFIVLSDRGAQQQFPGISGRCVSGPGGAAAPALSVASGRPIVQRVGINAQQEGCIGQ